MSDSIIWIVLIFVFIIIIGLYISEFSPLDLDAKQKILNLNYMTEGFTPDMSSTADQLEGASALFNWPLPDDDTPTEEHKRRDDCRHECKPSCPEICPRRCPIPRLPSIPAETCTPPPKDVNLNETCNKCDITVNKDIDKYVLKSSVPACPDMSEFITKNMINSNPDLNDYILKSEIKACDKVDISQYILKSEIPACPTCPICPECPICPVCPPERPQQKCKEIHEYSIAEHPDLSKYMSVDEVNKHYIKKDNILNSDIVKNYLNTKCSPKHTNNNHNGRANDSHKNNEREIKSRVIGMDSGRANATKDLNIFNTNFEKPVSNDLLGNDVIGYYAGDSSFAGI